MTDPLTVRDLLGRMDGAWKPFREAVRRVGRAKMSEQTGGGWTYHDLVAHVAGWHDLDTRRLRAFRTAGAFPGPGDEVTLGLPAFTNADEFNARIVSSHRLVGAEALVDELDTTFSALRSEVELLGDEQIHLNEDWVIAVVDGSTVHHYADHAKELSLE